jgi:hypothetical protein
MANQITYEYLFTLIDKITPTINKMAGQIDKMEEAFVRGQEKMQESTQKTISKMDMLIQKTKQMGDNMKNAGRNIQSMGMRSAFISAPTLLLAKQSINDAADFEQSVWQMNVTFGDAADEMMKKGTVLAKQSALSMKEVFQLQARFYYGANSSRTW